jgi:hypothetical protein
MNEYALKVIKENKRTQNPILDLGNCGLNELPDLSGMEWVDTLILSPYWWEYDLIRQNWTEFVSSNKYIKNRLENTQNAYTELPNLRRLIACNVGIQNTVFLKKFIKLKALDLSNNQISDCQFLEKLTNLRELHLSDNEINDYHLLEKLTKLNELHINGNRISDCRFLEKLTNLKVLELSRNQISDCQFLEKLTNLNSLDLSGNRISDCRFLEKLTNLHTLNLSNNCISDCQFLDKLTNLHTLNLSTNLITDISPLRHFIEKIGLFIVLENHMTYSFTINVHYNPLTNPPVEVVKQGNDAIIEYFRQKEKSGSKPLLEAKMVLLGDGRAGKTSLACRLLSRELPRQEDRTQGVDISIGEYRFPVDEGEFVLHIWDFAGQDKYKPLHQFFYTEGAVYVMVADSGNAQTDFADWFETAQMFGGEESPLLVALNEFREGMGIGTFDEHKWRSQFPKLIKEVQLVNLLTQKGLSILERNIRHFAGQLPHIRSEYPNSWANIRAELERRRDDNYITLKEYLKIAGEQGIPERESALTLSNVLHRIGVCLHYQNSDLLRQYVILKNEWATAAVYQILEDPTVAEINKGFFKRDDLRRIWSNDLYKDMQPQLLALMQEFGLAYPLPNQREYITPTLLPNTPPSDWSFPEKDATEIRIEYDFMPKALITQFIVSQHTDIDRNRTLVWREGVVMSWPGNTLAQVTKFKSRGRDALRILVTGSDRRGLLTSVVKTLRDLHREYRGIQVYEMIPCTCEGCQTGKNSQHYFEYSKLINRLEKGRREVDCDESLEVMDLMKLLGDVFSFERLNVGEVPVLRDGKRRKLNVFISSTFEDLQEHRKAVFDVLTQAGEYAIDMKYFGSRPDDAKTVCRDEISEADLIVGIYAWRYGWIPECEDRSITEMEFDYARQMGKPCLCYLVDENHSWPPKFIESSAGEKLNAFKKKVSQLVRSTFTTPDNLARSVMADLARYMRDRAANNR